MTDGARQVALQVPSTSVSGHVASMASHTPVSSPASTISSGSITPTTIIPPASASGAAQKVFDTFELAEMILAEFPLESLVLAMRINHTTCRIAKTSKAVLPALYWHETFKYSHKPNSPLPQLIDFAANPTVDGVLDEVHFVNRSNSAYWGDIDLDYNVTLRATKATSHHSTTLIAGTPKKHIEEDALWRRIKVLIPRVPSEYRNIPVAFWSGKDLLGYKIFGEETLLGEIYDWLQGIWSAEVSDKLNAASK